MANAWTINLKTKKREEKKKPKGLLDTDRALHKTEHWTESLFVYIYLKSSICLRTAHLHIYCLLIKQGWRNISSFLLQKKKKKQSSQRIKPTFVWNCNFDRSFLNHAATNSCVMETAQEMTRTSQNQRVVIFDLPHSPYLRDRTASNNSPTPGAKSWTCPGGYPGGMVAGQIEPCVKRKTGIVQLIIVLSSFLCRLWPKRLSKICLLVFPIQTTWWSFDRGWLIPDMGALHITQ